MPELIEALLERHRIIRKAGCGGDPSVREERMEFMGRW